MLNIRLLYSFVFWTKCQCPCIISDSNWKPLAVNSCMEERTYGCLVSTSTDMIWFCGQATCYIGYWISHWFFLKLNGTMGSADWVVWCLYNSHLVIAAASRFCSVQEQNHVLLDVAFKQLTLDELHYLLFVIAQSVVFIKEWMQVLIESWWADTEGIQSLK